MEIKPNNIYLGDCYELIKDIPSKSIDLIYTDIPYLYCQGGGGSSELGKRTAKKRIELMGIKNKEVDELVESQKHRSEALRIARYESTQKGSISNMETGIDYAILEEFCRVLKYIYIYIWCSKSQILPLMKYFIEKKSCIFEIFTWHKTNPTPTHNNCYPPDTEYCLLFREKGTGMGGTMETLKKYYISSTNKKDKDDYNHPTIKPLQIVENHLFNSANGRKDIIVLDPFVGSGTTCLAAKHLGLNYIGFEINPTYYQIAKGRLNGINVKGTTDLFNTDFEQLQLEFNERNKNENT